jgi:hypothetical protein
MFGYPLQAFAAARILAKYQCIAKAITDPEISTGVTNP